MALVLKLNKLQQGISTFAKNIKYRKREFLKLYLLPDNASNAVQRNHETLALANAIKSRKITELQNETHGFSNNKIRSKINLSDYIEKIAGKRKEHAIAKGKKKACSYVAFMNMHYHLTQYRGDKITFQQIDKAFCLGFIDYLRTAKSTRNREKQLNLSPNSQLEYLNRFKTVLNDAVADDIIQSSPLKKIRKEDKPKSFILEIEYLTNQELNILADTPLASMPMLKRAFLFSCYTGLRYSDITNLTWDCLRKNDAGRTLINLLRARHQRRNIRRSAIKPCNGFRKEGWQKTPTSFSNYRQAVM